MQELIIIHNNTIIKGTCDFAIAQLMQFIPLKISIFYLTIIEILLVLKTTSLPYSINYIVFIF